MHSPQRPSVAADMEKFRGNPKGALLSAHEEANSSDSVQPRYIWLDRSAERLAENLLTEVGSDDDGGWRLWYRLRAVGRSLHDYHQQTAKQTEEVVALISADYRSRLGLHSAGHLFTGLPSTVEYFEHRMLWASLEKRTAGSLEHNWLGLDAAIKSDLVLQKEYAILINRHASYIRADWHLSSFDLGVSREKSLRIALCIYKNLRRGIAFATCISVVALIWLGSQSGAGFLASILGVLLLGFCYAIFHRQQDRKQAWFDRAMSELMPFVRLEMALHAVESSSDLQRCASLAERLFEQGFVEMRYVLNVIAVSPKGPRRDED